MMSKLLLFVNIVHSLLTNFIARLPENYRRGKQRAERARVSWKFLASLGPFVLHWHLNLITNI